MEAGVSVPGDRMVRGAEAAMAAAKVPMTGSVTSATASGLAAGSAPGNHLRTIRSGGQTVRLASHTQFLESWRSDSRYLATCSYSRPD